MCETHIEYDPTARYPHKAVCTCGWTSWGYLTEHAAEIVAEGHRNESELILLTHHAS